VASQKRILALNIGASQLTLAEFKVSAGKAPMLVQYGIKPLGIDPDSDIDPSGYIIAALRDLLKEKSIRPGPVSLSISGRQGKRSRNIYGNMIPMSPTSRSTPGRNQASWSQWR